jgi:hypothetical protein
MTRAMQSRAVASERRDGPLALARAGNHLGTKERTNVRADVAALSRDRTADDAGLPAVCRALAGARLVKQVEDHIRRVVDAAPPLTAEQRDTLALLLSGAASDQPMPPEASTVT